MTDFKQFLKNKIKENKPSLSDNSINLYIRNIEKLNGNNSFKNLNFLKDTENILSKLDKYKDNTKRTYLISIVSSLLPFKDKFKKIHKIYYEKMINKASEIDEKPKNEKTNTQKENWITMDIINEKLDLLKKNVDEFSNLKKINESQFKNLLDYLILSLYTKIPPRRNMDYIKMKVVTKNIPTLEPNFNYLDLTNSKFIFNIYKTSKKYKDQTIDIPNELMDTIKLYLKFRNFNKIPKDLNIPFIVNFKGVPMNSSSFITKTLNRIFGKKIGASMIRHIYLSDKYGDVLQEMKKDGELMAHSIEQQKDYIKT